MATKRTPLIPGHAKHLRTQDTYMAAMLDSVSIDDWRAICTGAVAMAKGGDAQARAWLGQYLIGRPECAAPTAVNVIVNQLQDKNEVLDRLTSHTYLDAQFHDRSDDDRAVIRAQLSTEIAEKLQQANATQ